ncbi:MAG: PH domain-containing protein [Thermotogota bacterium]
MFLFYTLFSIIMHLSVYFWGLFLFVFLLVFTFYSLEAFFRYKKSRYIFQDDRIIQYSGGIFSDSQTELIIKNITHIKRSYPFIEYAIFKTGHICIEAAGSLESEVHINSVDNVEDILELLEKSMSNNGFNLNRDNLKYTENPDPLGVFFEVFKSFLFIFVVIIAYFVSSFVLDFLDDGFGVDDRTFSFSGLVVALVFLSIVCWLSLLFLDLLRRKYNIYENIITYTEGFLSKHYAFIPFKNLSDSASSQTFIDRIFGLYDVKLSSQGSGHEILFKNLKRGKEISDTLDYLIDEYKEESDSVKNLHSQVKSEMSHKKEEKNKDTTSHSSKSSSLEFETDFTDEFQMNINRHLFGIVFFVPLFLPTIFFSSTLFFTLPIFIFLSVNLIIQANFTTFYIKKKRMLKRFKFINAVDVEFSNEKITGVVINRNLIDYWFNTVSFKFFSIGSGSNLVFTHINYDQYLVNKILAKLALTPQKEVFNIDSKFSFFESLKSAFFMIIGIILFSLFYLIWIGNFIISQKHNFLWGIFPLIIIAFVWSVIYIYQIFFYRRSKLIFYKGMVYFQKGIFLKSYFFVRCDNIKDITTIKYPFSQEGDIRFNIAGETVINTKQGESFRSHNFTIKYVPNIFIQDELIDFILLNNPEMKEVKEYLNNSSRHKSKVLIEEKPSLYNSLFEVGLILLANNLIFLFLAYLKFSNSIFILLFALLIFVDGLILGIVSVYTLLKKYVIEDNRVLARWGIFYKKQTSVIFEKIDFLNIKQGFVNKMFGNGNITVNTTGSSKAELNINNIKNYLNFYQKIKIYKKK